MYPPGYTTGDEFDEIPDGRLSSINKNMFGGDTKHEEDDAIRRSYLRNIKSNKHMGDMADWVLDQANWEDPDWDDGDYSRPKIPEGYWKMKDGTLIEIKKMTDSHLSNAIALCERKNCYNLSQILIKERNRRAELMDKHKQKRDPLYAAFSAGWIAGHESAYNNAYPDIGWGGSETKTSAWERYKKSLSIDKIM